MASSPEPPRVQKAKALFDYEPEQPDELELKVGDIITVVESEFTFDGWMKGELHGVTGNISILLP